MIGFVGQEKDLSIILHHFPVVPALVKLLRPILAPFFEYPNVGLKFHVYLLVFSST
jgi:hypothetical protein